MIKLTQLLNELGINKPSEFNKLKVGKEYIITFNKTIYSTKGETDHFVILSKGPEWFSAINPKHKDNPEDYTFFIYKDDIAKVVPYKEEINELGINNPNPNATDVYLYYQKNIFDSNNLELWGEYLEKIKHKYLDKYFLNNDDTSKLIYVLSKSDLNKFYSEIQQLVQKYSNINELEIDNPNKTAEEVYDYYTSMCTSISIKDFIHIVKPIVVKYGYKFPMGARGFIMSLDKKTLNQLYRELKSEFNNELYENRK